MAQFTDRRGFLASAAAAAQLGLAGCAVPSVGDGGSNASLDATVGVPETIGLEATIDGLDAPLSVAFVPDADRRYVAERDGRVLLHDAEGLRDEPVLDLRETVLTEGEQGLLGLALHPEFATTRRLYVRYSAPLRSGMPEDYSHAFVLAEFEVDNDGTVRRDSERVILEIPEPTAIHNAGDLAFGPDGSLYVPVGDSGTGENGQDVTENLLGSVLRLDVDDRPSGGEREYAVPDGNPLVGREGRDEHFAWGFRNPWRLSFDDGELYVADVGQNDYEEVNRVENGGNYGWNVTEGTHCFGDDDCPDETPDGDPLRDPIVEYPHEGGSVSGQAVIGGYVSRGSAAPDLEGTYVFGDFVPEGRLFVAERPDGDADSAGDDGLWPTAAVAIDDEEILTRLLAFGRDGDGEVYALGTGADGGGLFRLASTA